MISLTERNATILFDALEICTDIEHDMMDIEKFLSIATDWLNDHLHTPAKAVSVRESITEVQSQNVVDIGIASGYVYRQLTDIITMIHASKTKANVNFICWWKPMDNEPILNHANVLRLQEKQNQT